VVVIAETEDDLIRRISVDIRVNANVELLDNFCYLDDVEC